jgi:hypothetical protein
MQQKGYKQKMLMTNCHIYWMPLCCGTHIADYIKCRDCKLHYHLNVLDWAQGPEQAKKAFERAILNAMVLFAMVNGLAVDAPELAKIHQIYQEMTNMMTTENVIMEPVDQ